MKNIKRAFSVKFLIFVSKIFFLFFITSCGDEEITEPADNLPDTTQVRILSFNFNDFTPPVIGQINHEQRQITVRVPRGGDLNRLRPTITYTAGATLSPPSGHFYSFLQPLNFRVRKGDKEVTYQVNVSFAASPENTLTAVRFPDLFRNGLITGQNITVEVPFGTDLSNVLMEKTVSPFATTEPISGTRVDLRQPTTVTVISESGIRNQFTLTVTTLPQDVGIRAFWIAPPWHSPFLSSYQNIRDGVALARSLNFNTLYVAAWAKTRTLFPSQVLLENSSYTHINQTLFGPYTGGSGDPLADLVRVAHANGLRVVLWFEYGFMARWGTAPTPQNDPILAVHPTWVGINNAGTQANYNNTDFYYNAYDPAVQQFMIDLVLEAVRNYNIDGIQMDDRMPAMPRNSGYDPVTVARYRSAHGGANPPSNYNDPAWVRWRADILNQFASNMYNAVKAVRPNAIVSFAPNPFPWAFDNLMQEWPVWLDRGLVDVFSVQVYRYSESAYNSSLQEVLHYFNRHGDRNLRRLVPGIILQGPRGLTDSELIARKLLINRRNGVTGEAFFFDLPIFDERIQRVIRAFYPAPAIFPNLN